MTLSSIPFVSKAIPNKKGVLNKIGSVVKKTALSSLKLSGSVISGGYNAMKMGMAQELPFLAPVFDRLESGIGNLAGSVKTMIKGNDDNDKKKDVDRIETKESITKEITSTETFSKEAVINDALIDRISVDRIEVSSLETNSNNSSNKESIVSKEAVINDALIESILVDKIEVSSLETKSEKILSEKLDLLIESQNTQNTLLDKQMRIAEERQIDLSREKSRGLFGGVKEGVALFVEKGKEKTNFLKDKFKEKASGIFKIISGVVIGGMLLLKDKISSLFSMLVKSSISLFSVAGNVIIKGTSALFSTLASLISTNVKGKIGGVVDKGSDLLKKGKGAVVKGATKFGGKVAGKALLKKIPLIGAVAGLGFAYSRMKEGDAIGAGLEALSGFASMIPVIGTGASIALDAYLVKRDMAKGGNEQQQNTLTDYNKFIKVRNGADIDHLNPVMKQYLLQMAQEYYQATGKPLIVNSGYRSIKEQEELWRKNPKKAAPPGRSLHNYGLAVDIQTSQLNQLESMGLMKKYGFTRPLTNESWHVEPVGIQGNIKRAKEDQMFANTAVALGYGKGGMYAGNTTSGRVRRVAYPEIKKMVNQRYASYQSNSSQASLAQSIKPVKTTGTQYMSVSERNDQVKQQQQSIMLSQNTANNNGETSNQNVVANQTVVNNYYINGQKTKRPDSFSF